MSTVTRRAGAQMVDGEMVFASAVVGVLFVSVGIFVYSAQLGAKLAGSHRQVPVNPVKLIEALHRHQLTWPPQATAIAAVSTLLLVSCTLFGWLVWTRRTGHIDRSARHMGRGPSIAPLTAKVTSRKSRSFGLKSPGLEIATAIAGGTRLYMDFESCCLDIWGMRRGKTTSRAVPTILSAPGPVLATSNKRDIVDMTRDVREQLNGSTWVFDPQQVAGEEVSWYWNPLSYVRSERHARELAAIFEKCSRPDEASQDAYFDPQGKTLVANLLLAAAVGGHWLGQVHEWASEPTNTEPAAILKKHGYKVPARALLATANLSDRQRDGLYGTALKICAFMEVGDTMEWVTAPSEWHAWPGREIPAQVPEFDPYDFVHSTREGRGQTLYLLSKEGEAGAAPLVTALTMAVCEAGEHVASRRRRGRLPIPMVVVLDEAANVCKDEQLPNKISHYGSRGIVIMIILQSYKQGAAVWGDKGMDKMWSAANVRVYGGGVDDMDFLTDLSKRIGHVDLMRTTLTAGGKQGRSAQRHYESVEIDSPADLAAMPVGRIIVLAGGAKPVLAAPRMWDEAGTFDKKRKQVIALAKASEAAHDPSNDTYIDRFMPDSGRRS